MADKIVTGPAPGRNTGPDAQEATCMLGEGLRDRA
jgi:hypothetical protein